WGWLGRAVLTLLAMATAGVAVTIPVWLALMPSLVSDSNWHSEVVVPTRMAIGIGAGVSVVVGVLVWRLRRPISRHGESSGETTPPTDGGRLGEATAWWARVAQCPSSANRKGCEA